MIMTAAGGAISSVVLELSSHYSGAKQRSNREAIGIQRNLEQGCYRTLSSTLVRTLAKKRATPRPLFGTAEVWREKAEVYEGAGEGAEGVSTRVFHCFRVLLLAISAHGFNGLRSKALLSRQRSRVRAPSSPP